MGSLEIMGIAEKMRENRPRLYGHVKIRQNDKEVKKISKGGWKLRKRSREPMKKRTKVIWGDMGNVDIIRN